MVLLEGQSIVIKISARNAGDIFNKLQHSIIDTVQHVLGANSDGETVTLDAKVAKSLCVQLETLRASLVDAEFMQALADMPDEK